MSVIRTRHLGITATIPSLNYDYELLRVYQSMINTTIGPLPLFDPLPNSSRESFRLNTHGSDLPAKLPTR